MHLANSRNEAGLNVSATNSAYKPAADGNPERRLTLPQGAPPLPAASLGDTVPRHQCGILDQRRFRLPGKQMEFTAAAISSALAWFGLKVICAEPTSTEPNLTPLTP
jgi:hypothetical protein